MWEHDTNLPSGRIRFALAAMERFEQEPGCEVQMQQFHGYFGAQCIACFGGIAALYYYKVPRNHWPSIDNRGDLERFSGDPTVKDFENTLDCARHGLVPNMFGRMGLSYAEGAPFSRNITHYDDDPSQFKLEMRQLADELEAAGY